MKPLTQLRVRYEIGRVKHALNSGLLIVPLTLFAYATTKSVQVMMWGALLYGVLFVASWNSQRWGDAMRFAMRWSLIPYVMAGISPALGHMCLSGFCLGWCSVLCTVGGLVAGLGISTVGHRHNFTTLQQVSCLAFVVGSASLACQCVGYSSIAGATLGTALGATVHTLTHRKTTAAG